MSKLFPSVLDLVVCVKLKHIRESYLTIPRIGVNQIHARGDTPLHIAARSRSLEVIQTLSEYPEFNKLRSLKNAEQQTPIELIESDPIKRTPIENQCYELLEEKVILAFVQPDQTDFNINAPKLITT